MLDRRGPGKIGGRGMGARHVALAAFSACMGLAPLHVVHAGEPPGNPDSNPVFIVKPNVQFGSYGYGADQFIDPSGVAITSNRTILIADCAANRVTILDMTGRPVANPVSDAHMRCPRGIAIRSNGNLLVVSSATQTIDEYSLDGRWLGVAISDPTLVDPYAVAVLPNGFVAVSDPGTHSVRIYSDSGSALRVCGTSGTSPGSFATPLGVASDGSGGFFVADQENARIQHLTGDCSVAKTWGTWGSYQGDFAEPAGLATSGNMLFVADLTNHRVQVFDLNGRYLFEWGRHPVKAHEGDGYLHYPQFIAVAPQGDVTVVCEPFEARCQEFDTNKVQRQVGAQTDPAFWVKFPRFHYGSKSIAIVMGPLHSAQETVCAELATSCGVKLPGTPCSQTVCVPAASTFSFFGLAVAEPDLSQVVILDLASGTPVVHARIGGYGSSPGQFRQPTGMAFDSSTGELYVSDGNGQRIEVFRLDGTYVRSFGTYGDAPGQVNGPSGLSFDDIGNLWVAEAEGNRIDVFAKDGTPLRRLGVKGSGALQFDKPLSVKFNTTLKRVYVDDVYNHRVQILTPEGRYVSSFGGDGGAPGHFIDSIDLTFDDQNMVYLSDAATDRVEKFDQDGNFITEWGAFGSAPGQFYKPKGVAVLNGRLVVIDFGNHRGQVFTLTGTPLGIFGEGIWQPTAALQGPTVPAAAQVGDSHLAAVALWIAVGGCGTLLLAAVALGSRRLERRRWVKRMKDTSLGDSSQKGRD